MNKHKCTKCKGKGIILSKNGVPIQCNMCAGKGEINLENLYKRIREYGERKELKTTDS